MSKARELAELGAAYDSGALSNRNMVYNGAFEVAQRGTSFSVTTSYTDYTLDRWRFYSVNGGAHTATQSTTVPNNSFKNSFKVDCTTADTSLGSGDYNIFAQLFEGQDLIRAGYGTSSAKKMTLSFWVRSNKTGTYYAELQLQSGGQASVPYTINAADTWEHKTCTFNGKTDSAPAYDTSVEMYLYFWLAAGSGFSSGTNSSGAWGTTAANRVPGQVNFADSTSNEWYITGVQLELGDSATPYEYRSFGDEHLRCLRYFTKSYTYATAIGTATMHGGVQTTFEENNQGAGYRENYGFKFPVEMRASPTIVIYDSAGTSGKCNYYVGTSSSPARTLSVSSTNATSFGGYSDRATTIGGWAAQYTADAEL